LLLPGLAPPFVIEPLREPLFDIPLFDIEPLRLPPFDMPLFDIPLFELPPFDIPLLDIPLPDPPPFDIPPFVIPPFDMPLFDMPLLDIPLFDIPLLDMFDIFAIFEFADLLALTLTLVVDSQAIPNAPSANTAERAKVFFISIVSPVFSKDLFYYLQPLFKRSCSKIFKFWHNGQYR
jgi:hypothetical protein